MTIKTIRDSLRSFCRIQLQKKFSAKLSEPDSSSMQVRLAALALYLRAMYLLLWGSQKMET
jgi:hypothetical protein